MAAEDGDPPPSATIYVRNLNERIKIPLLETGLRDAFKMCGNVIDIIAKKNVKARGQAFVVFDDVSAANDAMEMLQDFDLFGKPMQLAYAKTKSDATVEREDGTEQLEAHKKKRLAEKERKQALEATQKKAKRPAPESLAERPAKSAKASESAGGAVPDEYLPPNKILLLRDIPEEYSKDMLAAVFGRFAGFKEVRTVPGRTNIAFVEYENEEGAITAKESTSGITLGSKTIRVTFQRQQS